MIRKKPSWKALALIGIISIFALIEEAWLPLPATVDSWMLLVWVMLFYGMIGTWITHESEALENQPEPLDCVGRRILDVDAYGLDEPPTEMVEIPSHSSTFPRQTGVNAEC